MHTLQFSVPANAFANFPTFARFRVSTTEGLGFSGGADSGEVEDYEVTIVDPVPGDLNFDGAVDAADAVQLFENWGGSGAADLNFDGTIDAADAAVLFSNWTGDSAMYQSDGGDAAFDADQDEPAIQRNTEAVDEIVASEDGLLDVLLDELR